MISPSVHAVFVNVKAKVPAQVRSSRLVCYWRRTGCTPGCSSSGKPMTDIPSDSMNQYESSFQLSVGLWSFKRKPLCIFLVNWSQDVSWRRRYRIERNPMHSNLSYYPAITPILITTPESFYNLIYLSNVLRKSTFQTWNCRLNVVWYHLIVCFLHSTHPFCILQRKPMAYHDRSPKRMPIQHPAFKTSRPIPQVAHTAARKGGNSHVEGTLCEVTAPCESCCKGHQKMGTSWQQFSPTEKWPDSLLESCSFKSQHLAIEFAVELFPMWWGYQPILRSKLFVAHAQEKLLTHGSNTEKTEGHRFVTIVWDATRLCLTDLPTRLRLCYLKWPSLILHVPTFCEYVQCITVTKLSSLR